MPAVTISKYADHSVLDYAGAGLSLSKRSN